MDRGLQAQIETDPVLREATEWLLELRSGNISSQRITQWERWISKAAHRQAFDRVESLWQMASGVNARWPDESELAQDKYAGEEGITTWRALAQSTVHPDSRRRRSWPAPRMAREGRRLKGLFAFSVPALAAAAIMLVIYWPALRVFIQGGTRISLHTGIGESRTLTLQDGTIVSIGPDTTLTATLSEHSRTIVLETGDAYFRVKEDPARPFIVHAGRSTVRDLGTIFDIRHVDSGIVVSVAEGMVQVTAPVPHSGPGDDSRPASARIRRTPLLLAAGQRLTLEPFDTVPRISKIDPRWVASWRRGRLHYLDEPLGSVVADLDRYSDTRIVVTDPKIARLRVTAAVSLRSINAWLASLGAAFPLQVVHRADLLLIEPRKSHRLP
jgi:transmembrane sensor